MDDDRLYIKNIEDLTNDILNDSNYPEYARYNVAVLANLSRKDYPNHEKFWNEVELRKDIIDKGWPNMFRESHLVAIVVNNMKSFDEVWYESLSGTEGLTWEGLIREANAKVKQELQQQIETLRQENEVLRREKENIQTANGSLVESVSHNPSVQPGLPNQDRDFEALNLRLQNSSFEQEKERLVREFQQLHRTFGRTAHNPCQKLVNLLDDKVAEKQEQDQGILRHVEENKALQREARVLQDVKQEQGKRIQSLFEEQQKRDVKIQYLHYSMREQDQNIRRQVEKNIALQREVEQAHVARAEQANTIRELEREHLERDQVNQRLRQENQRKDQEYNQMYQSFSHRLLARDQTIGKFREEIMHQVEHHQQQMKSCDETLEELKQGILTREQEIETLKQEIQQKDQQHKQQTKSHDELTAELNQRTLTHVQRILKRDQEIETLVQRILKRDQEIETLEQKIETLGQNMQTLGQSMEMLELEIEQDSPSLEDMLPEDDDDE